MAKENQRRSEGASVLLIPAELEFLKDDLFIDGGLNLIHGFTLHERVHELGLFPAIEEFVVGKGFYFFLEIGFRAKGKGLCHESGCLRKI
jgi:hypothetical protein